MSSLLIGYFAEVGYIYEIENIDSTMISQIKDSENHLYRIYNTKKFIIKHIESITGEELKFKPKYNLNEIYNERKEFYRIKDLAKNSLILTTTKVYKQSKSWSLTFQEEILKVICIINRKTIKLFTQSYTNICKTYYKNGQLKCEVYIINNNREGEYKSYYENGNKYIKTYFINDKVNGNLKLYEVNGKLLYSQTYKDDQLHGEEIRYNNGVILQKCQYENNKKSGLEYEYNCDCTIKSIKTYVNGKIHGKRLVYWPNGKLHFKIDYQNGNRDGEHIEYDKNENIIVITKYPHN